MRRLLAVVAFLAFLLCCAPLAHGTSYYVDIVGGSDSAAGTSHSLAWAHAPGMTCATGTAASASFSPGDTLTFRGGTSETWPASCFPWNWTWSGTSGSHIAVTVDQTWYNGGSWARPVMNGGGTYPGNISGASINQCFLNAGANYVDESWLEWTGMYWTGTTDSSSASACYIETGSANDTFNYNYMHGWTHGASGSTVDSGVGFYGSTGGSPNGTSLSYNVCDGSDTTEDSFTCSYGTGTLAYNLFNEYVSIESTGTVTIHDNVFENVNNDFSDTHPNAYEDLNSCGATFYNNIVYNTGGGAEPFYMGAGTGCTDYIFNNLLYEIGSPGNTLELGDSSSGGTSVVYYAWNNTIEGGLDSGPPALTCIQITESPYVAAVTLTNNQCISSGLINNAPSGVTVTTSNNVGHALSSWNAQNYTNVQTYAFSPIADTGLYTTGTGTSTTGLCAMLSGAAATACASSTTYAVSYNTSNHTVSSPAVTSDSRPSLSPDVGVYQGVPGETSTCANPVISPASGAYSSPQTISMSDSTGGCTIYYTTNDTTPNCSSTSYSGPFSQPIVTSTYVEAIGCESGYTNSGVTTNTYTLAPISTTPGIAQGAAFTELFIDRNFLQGN